jgi:phage host-nuclease inhibitor protein Gam
MTNDAAEVAQAREKLNPLVSSISQLLRQQEGVAKRLEEEIEALKKAAAQEIASQQKLIDALTDTVYDYMEQHRADIFGKSGGRTLSLASGTIMYRKDPPSVVTKGRAKMETVLARAEEEGLEACIRWKPTINKEYLLENGIPEKLTTLLRVSQTERFVIKPIDVKMEVLKTVIRRKKK